MGLGATGGALVDWLRQDVCVSDGTVICNQRLGCRSILCSFGVALHVHVLVSARLPSGLALSVTAVSPSMPAGRREHSEWQRKYGYHVPVLELLVERFGAGVFGLEDIIAAGESYRMPALQYLVNTWVQAHAAGQQDSSGSKIAAGSGGARGWGKALSCAAEQGADLSLLRLLHERCGAAIDLAAVATGGSEDSIQWAVGTLRAARRVSPGRIWHGRRGG